MKFAGGGSSVGCVEVVGLREAAIVIGSRWRCAFGCFDGIAGVPTGEAPL
jgi:hypothetical protein